MKDRKFYIVTAVMAAMFVFAIASERGDDDTRTGLASVPAPAQDNGPTDREIASLALERVWSSATLSDRADICYGMGADPDLTVDTFMSAQTTTDDRALVMRFYRDKCSV